MRRIAAGNRVEPFETVRKRKGGELVDVSLALAPLYDDRGRVVGVSAIERDITRWRRAEAQVQRALEQRDRFIALLSHELRNPLMAITMAVATLSKSSNGDGSRPNRALEALERQSQYMARLLDDLVDVSRLRRGAIRMRKELFDLRENLESALDAVRDRAKKKSVDLCVEVSDDPIWVHGDAARLQQLVVNLLSNAVKFTPESKRVRLSADVDDGEARLVVSDDGIGLLPGTEEEIFEPFYQDDRATHTAGGRGMGLGLALVRALAEAHGGWVAARSEGRDHGSEFLVRLPLARPPASARHPVAREPGSRRVLVVEDDDDNRQLLALLLGEQGFEVHTAETGTAALAVMTETPVDVALVDLGLPDMSGIEVAENARQILPRSALVLIALTGHGRPGDRERVMAAGFDEHLVKPVRPDKILRVLEEAFSS
jgi:two-component system CheB/CheR fusion protein